MPKTGKNLDKDLVYPAVPMSAIKTGTGVLAPTETADGNSSDYLEGTFVRADGADGCRVKVYDDGNPRGKVWASSSFFPLSLTSPARKKSASGKLALQVDNKSQTFYISVEVTVKFREIAIDNDDWPSVLQEVAKAATNTAGAASKDSCKAAKAGKMRQTKEKRRHTDVFRRYVVVFLVSLAGKHYF